MATARGYHVHLIKSEATARGYHVQPIKSEVKARGYHVQPTKLESTAASKTTCSKYSEYSILSVHT